MNSADVGLARTKFVNQKGLFDGRFLQNVQLLRQIYPTPDHSGSVVQLPVAPLLAGR